ncbi:hypothetical protein [Primorskyibacter marinus]|uniref:hypothetical protein n=1 Tax=Primorskyibacter marinus TaxID=1977320 RepID=UPI000E308FC0|nr:hypothetical protein [Primorskyibacter marinus]
MAKKLLGLCIWIVAVIAAFFVAKAFSDFVILPIALEFAPSNPGEDYRANLAAISAIVGILRFVVWILVLWMIVKRASKWLYKSQDT